MPRPPLTTPSSLEAFRTLTAAGALADIIALFTCKLQNEARQQKSINLIPKSHTRINFDSRSGSQPLPLTIIMAAIPMLKNYINGEFVECSKHLDSYNPATGEVHLKVPDSGKEEVQAAVEAAKNAFKK